MNTYKKTTNTFLWALPLALVCFPASLFAYDAAPLSSTVSPTNITEQSVKLNGRVNPSDAIDTMQWFEWGISGRTTQPYETRHLRVYGGNRQITTSAQLIGLAPTTQYFFRQVAENSRGKNFGQTVYFTTKSLSSTIDPIALIGTRDASYVSVSSATIEAYMSPHGNSKANYWFEWGTSVQFENDTTHRVRGGNSAIVKEKLTRLEPGTTYYFRAVAESSEGRFAGDLKVFHTLGNPPPPSEAPRAQSTISPLIDDGINRPVTSSGQKAVPAKSATQSSGGTKSTKIGGGKSNDFWGNLFGNKSNDGGTATQETSSTETSNGGVPSGVDGETQGATASDQAASAALIKEGPFEKFWNSLSGKQPVQVSIEKIGPKKIALHTPVEYRITYLYNTNETVSPAELKIVLPAEIVYIGDNTTNELLLEEGKGNVRTYVLPIAKLAKGSTRTISLLGMTTGDAGNFPDVTVSLEYKDKSGLSIVIPAGGVSDEAPAATKESANVASSGGSWLLPHSLLGWLLYALFVVGLIFVYRKSKEYYVKRKEQIENGGDEQIDTQQMISGSAA